MNQETDGDDQIVISKTAIRGDSQARTILTAFLSSVESISGGAPERVVGVLRDFLRLLASLGTRFLAH